MKKIDYAKLNSLIKVADYFDSEKKCQQILEDSYWGDDVVCPKSEVRQASLQDV